MTRLLVLMKNGQEEIEALTMVDLMRRAGAEVFLVSFEQTKKLIGSHQIHLGADLHCSEMPEEYDAIYLPGGLPGAKKASEDERILQIIREADRAGKWIISVCAGPRVLEAARILSGRCITCYPGVEQDTPSAARHKEDAVVVDGNLITSRGPATAMVLALEVVRQLMGGEKCAALEKELLLPQLRRAWELEEATDICAH